MYEVEEWGLAHPTNLEVFIAGNFRCICIIPITFIYFQCAKMFMHEKNWCCRSKISIFFSVNVTVRALLSLTMNARAYLQISKTGIFFLLVKWLGH